MANTRLYVNAQPLRCFVTVATESGISRAAEKVNLSQSAVSLQIKHLEDSLGISLFDRTSKGLVLNANGEALLPFAKSCLDDLEAFGAAAERIAGTARETLRIGTILDPEFTRLGSLLGALARTNPGLVVELHHGTSDDALARISRRELDAGFYLDARDHPEPTGPAACDASGRPQRFDVLVLQQFVYRVAAPPGWEAKVLGKGWAQLAQLPWLATPAASAHRRLLAPVFERLRVEPRRSAVANQESLTLDLIGAGAGLGLVRDDVVRREGASRKLVIADAVHLDCVMSFVALRGRAESSPLRQTWDALREIWGAS